MYLYMKYIYTHSDLQIHDSIRESELPIRNDITMNQLGGREVLIRSGNVILSMSVADAAATLQDRILGWAGGITISI